MNDKSLVPHWTNKQNDRRCYLIDKEIDGTITLEEYEELQYLQCEIHIPIYKDEKE